MKKDYEVQRSINSGAYDEGDIITLDDADAANLLAHGIIKPFTPDVKPIPSAKQRTKKTKG